MAQHKTASKSGGNGRGTKRSTRKSATARPSRSASAHQHAAAASAGDDEVSIDRRHKDNRRKEEAAQREPNPSAPQLERRKKVNRRRQIDPTTCERDYTDDEVEFMNALDDYKRKSGRMFPTCSEVLEVVRNLGYVKLPASEAEAMRQTNVGTPSAKPMPDDWPAVADNRGTDMDADLSSVPSETHAAY